MKKRVYLTLLVTVGAFLAPLSTASASTYTYGRWYAGVKPSGSNYAGIHTALSTPSTMPYVDDGDTIKASMTLDWIEATGSYSTGQLWSVQTGYTIGYDDEAPGIPFYTVPESYVEWGPTNNLTEYQYSPQTYGSTRDYWVRWDSATSSWKVNINNGYIDNYYVGSSPAKVEAQAEINLLQNGNGPAHFSGNQYMTPSGSWYSLSNDSSFVLSKDANTGYTISGTVYDFTITK